MSKKGEGKKRTERVALSKKGVEKKEERQKQKKKREQRGPENEKQ